MDISTIRGGLIAAGTGSRFRQAGIPTVKPLIRVGSKPLLGWSMLQLESAGIHDVTVIFNTGNGPDCSRYLHRSFKQINFSITCRDTATSFESFLTVLSSGHDGHMLITTVDAIYLPGKIARLLDFAATLSRDIMVLGVTDFIDDEKPLYTAMNNQNRITALGGPPAPFVTSGVYYLPCSVARLGENQQFGALREFLGYLIEKGIPTYGFDMGTSIDVDRPRDLASAEEFIATHF